MLTSECIKINQIKKSITKSDFPLMVKRRLSLNHSVLKIQTRIFGVLPVFPSRKKGQKYYIQPAFQFSVLPATKPFSSNS